MINQVNYDLSGNVSVNETYSEILPQAIGTRQGLMVQNLGEENAFIALTKEQIARNGGFRIDPGVLYYFDTVSPKNAIYVRSETSAGTIIEFISNED